MNSLSVHGHDSIFDRFATWYERGRLASAYLFVGPEGVGKRQMAIYLAACLLCERKDDSRQRKLEACGECPACRQVQAQTHPDLLLVSKPPDKNTIPIKLLIGEDETRMKEGLCHDIALTPYRGGRKIAVIDDADFLNQEGANCLLKTLEEPPRESIIILIATAEHRQLPTVRSRCQIIRFSSLSPDVLTKVLQEQEMFADTDTDWLAQASLGSVSMACELSDPEVAEFRKAWIDQLAALDPGQRDFIKTINSFVEGMGKEGAAKRHRLRLMCDWSVQFYRHLMLALSGRPIDTDDALQQAVATAADLWRADTELVAVCIERCLDTYGHIAANANQNTMLECWLSDLGRISRGEQLAKI